MSRRTIFRTIWGLLLLLLGGAEVLCSVAKAQSTPAMPQRDTLARAIEERQRATHLWIAPYYSTALLHPLQYDSSLSQTIIALSSRDNKGRESLSEGTRQTPFSIQYRSLYHLDSATSVWGNASYTTSRAERVAGRESADYSLTAPYTSADTIGGFLHSEQYAFSGGYSHSFSPLWRWGVEGAYSAYQKSRDRDPRVLNSVGDLLLKAGIGYKWHSHTIGLEIGGRIYKQVHQMSFLNPKGAQFVLNVLGFDEYSLRFAGNAEAKAFNGHGYSIGLDYTPIARQGFFATAYYRSLGIEYTLKGRNELRLAYLQTHNINLTGSYLSTPCPLSWGISNSIELEGRRGDEYVYGLQEGIFYPLVAVQRGNYQRYFIANDLKGLLSLSTKRDRWEFLPAVRVEALYSKRKVSKAHEELLHLSPRLRVHYHHRPKYIPNLVVRAEGLLQHRFCLKEQLHFGALPEDAFYHPCSKKLRTIVSHNHHLQTINRTDIEASLRGEYLLPSARVAICMESRVAFQHLLGRVAPSGWAAVAGILF